MTQREADVLELMTTHLTYPQMAEHLGIATSTVRTHAKTVYRKLAVNQRSEAVSKARARGLIG